jgi:LacI family transcriptional regulator
VQSIAHLFLYLIEINHSFLKVSKTNSTIHDIARELKITASTVSRALNDHPRISVTTKEIVRDMARKLNYKPNSIASNLRKGKGNTIGVIIPIINRYFFANIIHGIESVANEAGYNILICQSNEDLMKEIESIKTLVNNRVNGIMISISAKTRNAKHFEPAVLSKIPVVQFDRIIETFDSGKILSDDFNGAYNTVKHLIEQGYRNIVHFAGPQFVKMYNDRLNGYKTALLENNIPYNQSMILEGFLSREKGIEGMKLILDKKIKSDALFAASDLSALGAIQVLKEREISIPGRFGVAGYVNELFAELIDPSLTTTEQFGAEIGKASAGMMLEQITQNSAKTNGQITIIPKLIIRDSTNRIKS